MRLLEQEDKHRVSGSELSGLVSFDPNGGMNDESI